MNRRWKKIVRSRKFRDLKRWVLIVVVAVGVSFFAAFLAEVLQKDYHVHYPRDEQRVEEAITQ